MRIKMKRMRPPDLQLVNSTAKTLREGIYLHFKIIGLLGVQSEFLFNPSDEIGICTVGRDNDRHVIVGDEGVSRMHFQVKWDKRRTSVFYIEDFNSTNGTRVDGIKLGPVAVPLEIDQIVSFGNHCLMWLHENPPTDLDMAPVALARIELIKRAKK